MKTSTLRADLLLVVAALAWGYGFVPQEKAMDYLSPLMFNGFRFGLGALALLPLAMSQRTDKRVLQMQRPLAGISLFIGISILGGVLFAAAFLQQSGISDPDTTAGKTAFITCLYIIFVPIIGIILKHKTNLGTWMGAIITFAGLFFLTAKATNSANPEAPMFAKGDLLVLSGAIFWAFHVLIIDHLVKIAHIFKLACGQFAVCAILSFAAAFILDKDVTITSEQFIGCLPYILYGGFISAGIGYTLQVLAQKDAPPAHAAIILNLESLFGAVAGYFFLNEILTGRNMFGASLMLLGILTTQLYPIYIKKKQKRATQTLPPHHL